MSRDLWKPKRPEAKQCAGCPFRVGNDKEFGAIVRALKKKAGVTIGATVQQARAAVYMDVIGPGGSGDFICHSTAYGPGMELRHPSEHRQCPGASELWKKAT